MTTIIVVSWEGPYGYQDVIDNRLQDDKERQDYGLYQIYGPHLIYANKNQRENQNVLLYIGLTIRCTFSGRISSHGFCHDPQHEIYLGYFENPEYETDLAKWESDVSDAERILINKYAPSYNSEWCGDLRKDQLVNPRAVIVNLGNRGDLHEKVAAGQVIYARD
jgi:hypothetical protein